MDSLIEPYPVMYIFVNKGLQMSAGKIAAQTFQAGVGALKKSDTKLQNIWWNEGGHHTTLIMEARDGTHLHDIAEYLEQRGFDSFKQIDEGMTEIPAHTPTALAAQLVDKSDPHVRKTFEAFKLYKDTVTVKLEIER